MEQDKRNPMQKTAICPNCKEKNYPTAKFCTSCGVKLIQPDITTPVAKPSKPITKDPKEKTGNCPNCNAKISPKAIFCTSCGNKLVETKVPKPKPKIPQIVPKAPETKPKGPKLWERILESPKYLFIISIFAACITIFWSAIFLFPDLIKISMPTINDIFIAETFLFFGILILLLYHISILLGAKIKEEWGYGILVVGMGLGHFASFMITNDIIIVEAIPWKISTEIDEIPLFLVLATFWLIINLIYYWKFRFSIFAGFIAIFSFTTIERLAYSRILNSKELNTVILLLTLLFFGFLWLGDIDEVFGPGSWLAALLVGINPHTLSGFISSVTTAFIVILPPIWILLKVITKKKLTNLPLILSIASITVFMCPLALISEVVEKEVVVLIYLGVIFSYFLNTRKIGKTSKALYPPLFTQASLLVAFIISSEAILIINQMFLLLFLILVLFKTSDKAVEPILIVMTLLISLEILIRNLNDEIAIIIFILAFIPLISELIVFRRIRRFTMYSGLIFPPFFLSLRIVTKLTDDLFSVLGIFFTMTLFTVFIAFLFYSKQLTPQERELSSIIGLLMFILCVIASALAKWPAETKNLEYGELKVSILLFAFILITVVQSLPQTPELPLLRLGKISFAPALATFYYLGSFDQWFSIVIVTFFAIGHSFDVAFWLNANYEAAAYYLRDGTIIWLTFTGWLITWWDKVTWIGVEYMLLFVPTVWTLAGIKRRDILTKDASFLLILPSLGFLAAIVSKNESFSTALSYSNVTAGIFLGLLTLNLLILFLIIKQEKEEGLKLAPVVPGTAFILMIGILLTETVTDYWALIMLSLILLVLFFLIGIRWFVLDQVGGLILNLGLFITVILLPMSLVEDLEHVIQLIVITALILSVIISLRIQKISIIFECLYVLLMVSFCVLTANYFFDNEFVFQQLAVINIALVVRYPIEQIYFQKENKYLPYIGLFGCICGLILVGADIFSDDVISFIFLFGTALSWLIFTYFSRLMKDGYIRYVSINLSIATSIFWINVILQAFKFDTIATSVGLIASIGFYILLVLINEFILDGEPHTSAILFPTMILGLPIIFFTLEGSYLVTIGWALLSFICLSIALHTGTQELKIMGGSSYILSFCKVALDTFNLSSTLEKAAGSAAVTLACFGIAVIIYFQQRKKKTLVMET